MLGYRHAFHAGNHADVLKHFVLCQCLQYFNEKDKPYTYIDTHAGAGLYKLDHQYAVKTAEFRDGITKLFESTELNAPLQDYIKVIKHFNGIKGLKFYPGSPLIASRLLRNDERARFFELHTTDSQLLQQAFNTTKQHIQIKQQDGFAGIKALLPPPNRRSLVMIDPSFEEKQDYVRVVDSIKDSLTRFATGTYILWYPQLQRAEPLQLLARLYALNLPSWLHITLNVQAPKEDGFGMFGSSLFIINPPYTLPKILESTMPILTKTLALHSTAHFNLDFKIA